MGKIDFFSLRSGGKFGEWILKVNVMKIGNEYAQQLEEYYDKIPKAVLAAIAVSFATFQTDDLSKAPGLIYDEWITLHANGIVKQKPRK